MSKAHLFHVDAFTSQALHGAPAPVIVVDEPLSTHRALALTAELNQSVTVFIRPVPDGCEVRFFEVEGEVGLVGHAGLAAGFVALERLFPERDKIALTSPIGGVLPVERKGNLTVLEFRATQADVVASVPCLDETLGDVEITERLMADFGSVAVLADEDMVHSLRPDLERALDVPGSTVIVTAPGREVDFVSRVFAPKLNLPEDPVCGTAHRILVPYWATKLGRSQLSAHQVSERGGHFQCESRDGRVYLGGRAVTLFECEFELP